MLRKKIAATTLSLLMAGQVLIAPIANANTVSQVVDNIKEDSSYQSLVDKLTSTGYASERDVESFVQDVVSQLDGQDINESNVEDLVKDAALQAISGNSNVLDAVLSSFSSSDIKDMQDGKLPSSLRSLGDLFKRELLNSENVTDGAVGAGGGAALGNTTSFDMYGQAVVDSDAKSLTLDLASDKLKAIVKERTSIVILEEKDINEYNLVLRDSELRDLKQALTNLTFELKGFAVNIPLEKVTGSDKAFATISLKEKAAEQKRSPYTLLTPVVENTVSFEIADPKGDYEIAFAVPQNYLEKSNLLGIYKYNEDLKEWEYIGGSVDKENGLIWTKISKNGTYTLFSYSKTFADVINHWAMNDIEEMSSIKAVSGISDEYFKPDNKITRAEFAAMLQKALKLEEKSGILATFSDIPSDAWYSQSVKTAAEAGLIKGTAPGLFEPNRLITREEMAVILLRAMGESTQSINPTCFADESQISPWARESIKQAYSMGLTGGKGENKFAPLDNSTRAEAIVMLKRLLTKEGKL